MPPRSYVIALGTYAIISLVLISYVLFGNVYWGPFFWVIPVAWLWWGIGSYFIVMALGIFGTIQIFRRSDLFFLLSPLGVIPFLSIPIYLSMKYAPLIAIYTNHPISWEERFKILAWTDYGTALALSLCAFALWIILCVQGERIVARVIYCILAAAALIAADILMEGLMAPGGPSEGLGKTYPSPAIYAIGSKLPGQFLNLLETAEFLKRPDVVQFLKRPDVTQMIPLVFSAILSCITVLSSCIALSIAAAAPMFFVITALRHRLEAWIPTVIGLVGLFLVILDQWGVFAPVEFEASRLSARLDWLQPFLFVFATAAILRMGTLLQRQAK